MIGWVDSLLQSWGRAKRSIETRPYTVKSFLGRIREEGSGSSYRNPILVPPEVMEGDALEASVAIQTALETDVLSEDDYELLYIHYVARDRLCGECGQKHGKFTIGDKHRAIGISRAEYFTRLHHIQVVLSGLLGEQEV